MSPEKSPPQGPAIVWFRKDLRLADNHALSVACAEGRPVIPVFILDADQPGSSPLGAAQAWWLHHSLAAFGAALEKAGSRLILRRGNARKEIEKLVKETAASAVIWNRRYDPKGVAVDGPLKQALTDSGLSVRSFPGELLHEPSKLLTGKGGPYRVYTPFWRALEQSGEPDEPFDQPDTLTAPAEWPASEHLGDWALLPTRPDWAAEFTDVWTPGEQGALDRLAQFIKTGLDGYKIGRDFPGKDATSRLSPHLALGEIAPARIWHATRHHSSVNSEDIITFRKELVWRDFSYHLLFHNPDLGSLNLNRSYDTFPWRNDDQAFRAWTRGMTGYPIVDAGMRQLWRHGIMHNRVRMIVASFLIKDLLIDWRRGEEWFRDTLVDADPASNTASWQWVAGSGADAAPFFRVFNPVLQGERFDPDGLYIRQFVPELEKLPSRFIHRPFEAPGDILREAGFTLGTTYPKPIVNHAEARDRALAAYRQIKDAA